MNRTWNTLAYGDISNPGNWSGGGPISSADTLVMRHGSGYLNGVDLRGDDLLVASYLTGGPFDDPATLFVTNSSASVNVGAYGAIDQNASFGNRQTDIVARGQDNLRLTSSGPGTSTVVLTLGLNASVGLQQSFGTPTFVHIEDGGGASLRNDGASLYNVTEAVNASAVGAGTWNLWGNDAVSFSKTVVPSETISLHNNSYLQLNDAPHFMAHVTADATWNNYVFLTSDVHADGASYDRDMTSGQNILTITAAGNKVAQFAFDDFSRLGFEVVGTPWGASIVSNSVQDAPPGMAILLRHAGPG